MVLFKDIWVIAPLIVIIYWVLKTYNVIGNSKGVDASKKLLAKEKSLRRKRRIVNFVCTTLEQFALSVGGKLSLTEEVEASYRIERMNVQIDCLGRRVKAIEAIGLFRLISFIGAVLAVAIFIMAGSVFGLLFLGSLGVKGVVYSFVDNVIADEDKELETDFPDLYLLLYSRLARGAYVRLGPTLTEYYTSLENTTAEYDNKAIKKFVRELRSNIELYADDSLAVNKLRERYKSAMIVNFINLAMQSLSGVDNKDKLTSFKDELITRKMKEMEQRAEALVARGRRAIAVVYVVLFEFVILSFASKIGSSLSGLSNLFGV